MFALTAILSGVKFEDESFLSSFIYNDKYETFSDQTALKIDESLSVVLGRFSDSP